MQTSLFMASRIGVLFFCLADAGTVAAQSVALQETLPLGIATVGDRPFYQITASIPSNVPALEGNGAADSATLGYVFEFLAAPDGDVVGLAAYALQNGRRDVLCQPIPVNLGGNPPRTIYLVPCGPGGGGTLSIESLIVEFNLDSIDPSTGEVIPFGITLQEIIGGEVANPLQLQITLPMGRAVQ